MKYCVTQSEIWHPLIPRAEREGTASTRRIPHPAVGAGGVREIRAALNEDV